MNRGKPFLLKVSDGKKPPSFSTIAGMRATSEKLENCRYSVSAYGSFLGREAAISFRDRALRGLTEEYELSFEDGVRIRGLFLIHKMESAGGPEDNDWAISMERMGGTQPFTAAVPTTGYGNVGIGRLDDDPGRRISELEDLLCLADDTLMNLNGCFPLDPGPLRDACLRIRAETGDDYGTRKTRARRALEKRR